MPKIDFDHLTQQEAATLFSVDVRTLRRWEREHRERRGFPRNADGTYNLSALMWWAVANKIPVRW
jgi:hypothetical protein